MERNDEALVLYRQIYARRVEKEGVSHLATITSALSLAVALGSLKHWDEAISLLRDQLPVARRSLGADHHLTLLNKSVTADPERTRDNPVFESTHIRAAGTTFFVPTQAKTCSKPISWCRTCSRGDGESSDPRMRTRLKQSPCCPDCANFFERLADVDSV